MERPYIFFHMGAGLLVCIVVLPIMVWAGAIVLSLFPEGGILPIIITVVVCAPLFGIPCCLDSRLARKKQVEDKVNKS